MICRFRQRACVDDVCRSLLRCAWPPAPAESPSDVADADQRAEHAEDAARDTHHERSER